MASDEVVIKFPEWQVNAFDIDCTSNWTVLAVQKWLAVISLDCVSGMELGSGEGKEKAKRKLGTHNKYEIKAVRWNPHFSKQQLLACTNHQKVDIWDTQEGRQPLASIKAHTRPVCDLSWSSNDPYLIATCAVDSFVYIWDMRDFKRPKVSFKTLGGLNSGASLVHWNRINGSVLASAHDSDIRVWDMKKPSTVFACISAHMNKIYDLDWSYKNDHHLTTCSHDATIKFWDIQSPREPQSTIKTGTYPIWRAQNCPFGHGVAMVLVPAVHSGDSRVFIWNRTNVATPVCTLTGHSEAVVDVQWRKLERDCQLVSLSKDRTLHIWSLGEQLQQDLDIDFIETSYVAIDSLQNQTTFTPTKPQGIEAETSFSIGPNIEITDGSDTQDISIGGSPQSNIATTSTPNIKTNLSMQPQTPSPHVTSSSSTSFFGASPSQTLAQEFALLKLDIPNMEMEIQDPSQRSCTVKMEQGGHLLRLGITFPSHYPNGAAPSFILDTDTTIDIASQQELIRVVNDTAYTNVRANRPCLEQCLRKLARSFENLLCRPEPPVDPPPLTQSHSQSDFDISFGKLDDDRIPFPRTSGARFCSNGYLVYFSCPMALPPDIDKTPKSLDMLHQFKMHSKASGKGPRPRTTSFLPSSLPNKKMGNSSNLQSLVMSSQSPLITSKDRSGSHGSSKDKSNRKSGEGIVSSNTAVIFDVSSLLPVDYNLAKSYSLIGNNIQELCTINASVAVSFDRPDLVTTWQAIALIANTSIENSFDPHTGTPWAMHPFGRQLIQSLFIHYGQLHDVQTLAMLACICQLQCCNVDRHFESKFKSYQDLSHTVTPSLYKKTQDRTNLWEGVLVEVDEALDDTNNIEEMTQHQINCRLLDEVMSLRCDEYIRCYGNILYSWGLLIQRSEIMKHQSPLAHHSKEITLANQCKSCRCQLEGPYCMRCQLFALTCVVCNLAVKGCSNICLSCGHGGHTHHLMDWFVEHEHCPSGCGCKCLEMSG